jgi:two-component system OmpR family response regulator
LRSLPSHVRRIHEGNPRVLLIGHDTQLSGTLARHIRECGFEVAVETTGRDALERLSNGAAEVVILDPELPDIDGMDVLLMARERGVVAPVLVVSRRSSVESRVAALDSGADDYLVKPFAYAELVSRVRALQRRGALRSAPLCFGDFKLETDRLIVSVGANAVVLSPKECAILQHLIRRGCTVSSRREILSDVFGYNFDPGTNVIQVHIARLRRKLVGGDTQIETVRGAGYRLRVGSEGDRKTAS